METKERKMYESPSVEVLYPSMSEGILTPTKPGIGEQEGFGGSDDNEP